MCCVSLTLITDFNCFLKHMAGTKGMKTGVKRAPGVIDTSVFNHTNMSAVKRNNFFDALIKQEYHQTRFIM